MESGTIHGVWKIYCGYCVFIDQSGMVHSYYAENDSARKTVNLKEPVKLSTFRLRFLRKKQKED